MRNYQTIYASSFGRHSHRTAYAALVLSGSYEEAGDQGRFYVREGDVVFHDRYEAHLNRFSSSGAVVLNLPLPGRSFRPGLAAVSNPDAVARIAERNLLDAADFLLSHSHGQVYTASDWPDELASVLRRDPDTRIGVWGEANKLAPWTISRGFAQTFGITPEAYRARARALRALTAIQTTSEPLAALAANLGFSDQSHMTRSVKQLTGLGPHAWRSSANGFKTEEPDMH